MSERTESDRMNKREMLGRILTYYGLGKNSDAARYFGVSEQAMFMRVKRGILDLEEVYEKCPEISPDWLLSGGKGEMIRANRDAIGNGNVNVGDYSKQEVIIESRNLEMALESLAKEQAALAKAQEQISGLIEILKK